MKKTAVLATLLCLTACTHTPIPSPARTISEPGISPIRVVNPLPSENLSVTTKSLATPVVILPHEHSDVWQRIRSQLSIDIPNNKAVAKWRNYYLSHPRFMITIAERAAPFLHYIVEEIERRNMPVELALLPIVESAYLPYGVSDKSAAGLWQFMPVTAKRFKLSQNDWYDGRRDIVESTRAALDYFGFFYKTLDQDWLNAIAAFNSGEGRVGREVAKNKRANLPADFWSLDLPKETSNFVPKLLAIADILKRSTELNYVFTPIENKAVVSIVKLTDSLDLSIAAQWANIETEQLLQLNPALNRWATSPDSEYKLLIPVSSRLAFTHKMATTDKAKWLQWQEYKVKAGDSLSTIAYQYRIDIADIKELNQLTSTIIRIGKTLRVPLLGKGHYSLKTANSNKTKRIYTVKKGDNLWKISLKYKVKIKDIARWNDISSRSVLQPKQKLKILL